VIKLNYSEYLDKVRACWIGKNIGGTIGGPFEGKREILNVTGYTTPPGEPLPNDDLDLQLIWLHLCILLPSVPKHPFSDSLYKIRIRSSWELRG